MTEFDQRLAKAIERGQRRGHALSRQEREKALTEEELRQLHTKYRLAFSEHIERCIKQVPSHFPGFQVSTIYGERGWGAACSRDDAAATGGRRANFYSRLEMTIRPFSSSHVVELAAKGTIRDKEVFNRTHFEQIHEVDSDTFVNLIDVWVLEYAELFAARA